MKYGIVAGERHEPARGLSGQCPACGSALVAKCGDLRVHHWAHKGVRTCDAWWEPETEWHRKWKDQFPKDWQEVIQRTDGGEKHIADVKTEHGHVLEFQHSPISTVERKAREAFYRRMSWIVDGTRRKRDLPSFCASLDAAHIVKLKPYTLAIVASKCALLRDWARAGVPVFFDFGDQSAGAAHSPSVVWRLDPKSPDGEAYLSPVLKARFLQAHTDGVTLRGMHVEAPSHSDFASQQAQLKSRRQNRQFLKTTRRRGRVLSFREYWARKERARSRRRF